MPIVGRRVRRIIIGALLYCEDMTGAKGKYNPENIQRCLDAISLYGTDKSGYSAIPIHKDTFYKWVSDKSDFSDRVATAHKTWQDSQGSTARLKAWDVLKRYLFEGQVEHWTIVKDVIQGIGDDSSIVQLTETRTVRKTTPQWVIERYLGKGMHEIEALQAIAAWLPQRTLEVVTSEIGRTTETISQHFAGTLPDISESKRPGLSDETAGIVRSQILGIDASDTVAISGQVGSRQEPGKDNRKVEADRD